MKSRFDFDIGAKGVRPAKPTELDALRMLVIADLRGDARTAESAPLANARVHKVTVDNFEELLRELSPTVTLQLEGQPDVQLSFTSLQHFHPDHLFDTLEVVAELRRSRERLLNDKSYASERARLLADAAPAGVKQSEDNASTLGRLLGGHAAASAQQSAASTQQGALDDLIRSLIGRHISHVSTVEQKQLVASLDASIASELRRVLHAPAFQRLEAAWRGLHWLVSGSAVGDELVVHVLDATRDALLADIRACEGQLTRSQLYRMIVEGEVKRPGGKPYALTIADLTVSGSESDVALLAGLAAVAAQSGGSLLAAADPILIGCAELTSQAQRNSWSELDPAIAERMALLRNSPVAPFIGLLLPRVLGRLPYGKRSDPIERFDFSELLPDPEHSDFLWINPAFACAQLVASAFAQESWNMRLEGEHELTDLPLAMVRVAGGDEVKPCAEVCLDYTSAEVMLRHGLMPLLSHKSSNAVRLLSFQALNGGPLAFK